MTRPIRFDMQVPRAEGQSGLDRPNMPAVAGWIESLALAEPVGFPLMVGTLGGALADSMAGFAIGVAIGLLARLSIILFRRDDGVA